MSPRKKGSTGMSTTRVAPATSTARSTPPQPVATPTVSVTPAAASLPARVATPSAPAANAPDSFSLFTDFDIHLFREGSHYRIYDKLGAHVVTVNGVTGTFFAVWAPNARSVSVIGDFNGWNRDATPLRWRTDGCGIWEGFVAGVAQGTIYKYFIVSHNGGQELQKQDPYGFFAEVPPKSASMVWDLAYEWQDSEWMKQRARRNSVDAPMSIYEVHLGSWQRKIEEGNRSLTYREMAVSLVNYVKEMGFTHVEFLPVMEHPLFASWGYQVVGYFAAGSRFGTPQDLMFLIDQLHQNGIGVILDWVPSHFPVDGHGLMNFDGTHLFEHADPRQGFHPDWGTAIFNYGRNEIRDFLIANALFWLDKYHADGLRVDAVASMLYLDYSRRDGEWIANQWGGKENVEAIDFMRCLNATVYSQFPDIQMIAEESTSWGGVSHPTHTGGLGFGMKWNMGWMHDTLSYFSKDPVYRKYHHNELTFSQLYAYTENFLLPLSHDEVVHGKGSLLGRMPGDEWQKFANLRAMFGYFYAHSGKKLLFMGGEFGQFNEWYHETSLDWHLLQYPAHQGMKRWVSDLNHFYRSTPALYELDSTWQGFEWIDCHDYEKSILAFIRRDKNGGCVAVICNFTPMPHYGYRVGVPYGGMWREALNSDAAEYGGSGTGNAGRVMASDEGSHWRPHSLTVTVPPLGVVMFQPENR